MGCFISSSDALVEHLGGRQWYGHAVREKYGTQENGVNLSKGAMSKRRSQDSNLRLSDSKACFQPAQFFPPLGAKAGVDV